MSFTLELMVDPLPASDKEAWAVIDQLRASYHDDTGNKAPALLKLHQKLTQVYPCLCSYADDDEDMDNCPWADGPMINNFASKMGMLAIVFSRADELLPLVIEESNELGITVADAQSRRLHRPKGLASGLSAAGKPWWKFW